MIECSFIEKVILLIIGAIIGILVYKLCCWLDEDLKGKYDDV